MPNVPISKREQLAWDFARAAHSGQVRKFSGLPYFDAHVKPEAALWHIDKNDLQTIINELLMIDLARNLYFSFGTKIINSYRKKGTAMISFTISISDAVVLIACLNFNSTIRNQFETYTAQKFTGILHKNLINNL